MTHKCKPTKSLPTDTFLKFKFKIFFSYNCLEFYAAERKKELIPTDTLQTEHTLTRTGCTICRAQCGLKMWSSLFETHEEFQVKQQSPELVAGPSEAHRVQVAPRRGPDPDFNCNAIVCHSMNTGDPLKAKTKYKQEHLKRNKSPRNTSFSCILFLKSISHLTPPWRESLGRSLFPKSLNKNLPDSPHDSDRFKLPPSSSRSQFRSQLLGVSPSSSHLLHGQHLEFPVL